MEAIKTYFNHVSPLTEEEWRAIEVCFEKSSFNKGELILQEGERCEFIGFLRDGVTRFYHLKDGDEKVTAFWFAGDFLSNYRSFVSGLPSTHIIEAITPGFFWKLPKKHLERLYDEYPAIDRLGRKMAEQLYLMVSTRLDQFLQQTPEGRYSELQAKNSRLLHEIPQYMIASYLGVSAETLSRIRKRIHNK